MIIDSVAKTGALVAVQEGPEPFGLGRQVVSVVAMHDPRLLRVPPRIVGPSFAPTPFAPALENLLYPNAQRVADQVMCVLERSA